MWIKNLNKTNIPTRRTSDVSNVSKAQIFQTVCHRVGSTVQSSDDIRWKKTNSFHIISLLQTLAGLPGNCRLVHWEHALSWHGNKTPPTTHVLHSPHTAHRPAAWRHSFRHVCMTESNEMFLNHSMCIFYMDYVFSKTVSRRPVLTDNILAVLLRLLRYKVESSVAADSQQ